VRLTLLALVVLEGLEASKGSTAGNHLMAQAGLVVELRLVVVTVVCWESNISFLEG